MTKRMRDSYIAETCSNQLQKRFKIDPLLVA